MVIIVRNVSGFADTNAQGDRLFGAITHALSSGTTVTVDFSDVSNATSSFVNSSFVRLLDLYDFATIQKLIRIVGTNRQVANMIKARMQYEAA